MNKPKKFCVKGRSKSRRQLYQHSGLSVRYKEATTFEVVAYSLEQETLEVEVLDFSLQCT